jgi:RNA polymerase sigma-70 factor (ECF subfamily)
MTTDEQLLAQFCAVKNPAIFDELVARHADQVRATICRMVRNKADVDDLTQEVFLRAFQGVARFRGKARFSTWLHRIAVNTVYTFCVRQKNCRCKTYDELPETMDTHACPCEELLMQDEWKARLETAMKALAPKLRAALELAVVAGMETGAAARIEGCAPATMYWRTHQARKILKERLA